MLERSRNVPTPTDESQTRSCVKCIYSLAIWQMSADCTVSHATRKTNRWRNPMNSIITNRFVSSQNNKVRPARRTMLIWKVGTTICDCTEPNRPCSRNCCLYRKLVRQHWIKTLTYDIRDVNVTYSWDVCYISMCNSTRLTLSYIYTYFTAMMAKQTFVLSLVVTT